MKKLKKILYLLLLATSILSSCGSKNNNHTQEQNHDQYACPMHPEIKGDKDDKCSQCGMDLEKVK